MPTTSWRQVDKAAALKLSFSAFSSFSFDAWVAFHRIPARPVDVKKAPMMQPITAETRNNDCQFPLYTLIPKCSPVNYTHTLAMIMAVHVNIIASRLDAEPAINLLEKGMFPSCKKKVLKSTVHHCKTMTPPACGGLNVFARTAIVIMLATLRA